MNDDASTAQYATPTPTCLGCLHPSPPKGLPHTGFAVGTPLLAGLVLIVAGLAVRGRLA